MKQEFEEGKVLLINKPLGWTSFDVVRKLRNLIRVKKIGHAGTLDPLASGLLILCTGKFTKKINEYMSREKEYIATLVLGAVTPTYDLESEPVENRSIEGVTREKIEEALEKFRGGIMQVPPAHSALKQGGKRVYELARAGKEVKLEPRPVNIKELELTSVDLPSITIRVVCSTGTYIRSLAHDIGQALGCGAYLSALCRTRIGEFELSEAESLEDFEKKLREGDQNIKG